MDPEEEKNDIRPPTRDEVLKEMKELETELIRVRVRVTPLVSTVAGFL